MRDEMCALEPDEGFATASDGVRIFYRVSGKGPFAVVMPVNWGIDSYVYAKGLSPLEFYLALVTFDPRGVGRSDSEHSPEEFAMDVTARDGAAVADALRVDRSVVIGHSSGGGVALTFVLRYPERVSHLVLVSTAARWTSESRGVDEDWWPATEEEMRADFRRGLPLAVQNPARFLPAMDALLPKLRFAPRRWRWCGEVEFEAYDVRSRLKEIRVPTIIIHGAQDRVIPIEDGEELRSGIRGSHFVRLENCGHWPFVEEQAEFVASVMAFLSRPRSC